MKQNFSKLRKKGKKKNIANEKYFLQNWKKLKKKKKIFWKKVEKILREKKD